MQTKFYMYKHEKHSRTSHSKLSVVIVTCSQCCISLKEMRGFIILVFNVVPGNVSMLYMYLIIGSPISNYYVQLIR